MKNTLIIAAALGAGLITDSTMYLSRSESETVSRKLENGKLILTFERIEHVNVVYAIDWGSGPAPKKTVWREIYACGTNGIVLERVEHAKVTPPQTVTTPEKIEWEVK